MIVYLDNSASTKVDEDVLKKMLPYFSEANVQAVTSSLKVYQPQTILQYIQNIEYTFGIYLRKTLSLIGSIKVTPGPLTLFRRSVFDKIGHYHQAYNTEDLEIALRLQSHNFQIENAVDAYVYTVTPASFRALYRQRVRWYQGLLRNSWGYKNLLSYHHGNLGVFILPATFLGIFFLLSISAYAGWQIIQQGINLFLSWQAIGFDISQFHFDFNWFFINSQFLTFLSLFSLLFSSVAIFLGQKLSKDVISLNFGKGLVLAAFFYGPLYLCWWLGAVIQVSFNRHPHWTKEKEIVS